MKKLKITKQNKADLQAEFVNHLVKDLFNAVTTNDFLMVAGNNVIHNGHLLSGTEKTELINGAKSLKQMVIWQVLISEMKNIARKRIWDTSKTIEDIVFGKAMLYAIDVMEKKVENLSNLR